MAGLLTFALIYSCGEMIFYPCDEMFDYTVQLCGGACYQFQPLMGTIDVLITVFLPLFLITLFTVVLIIRVIYQKRRMQQKNIRKKNLRMLIQLLSVVILHLVVWMPACVVLIISVVQQPAPALIQELQYSWVLLNFIYIGVLGSPFTSLVALPELKEKAAALMDRVWARPMNNRTNVVPPNTR